MIKNISLVVLGIALGFGGGFLLKNNVASQVAVTAVPTSLPSGTPGSTSPSTATGQHFPQSIQQTVPPGVPQVAPSVVISETSAALALLGEARSHREVVAALENLLPRLRGGNLQEMAASAMQLPEGPERDMALMLSLGELAEKNPAQAV
jgi:hypothetical protein